MTNITDWVERGFGGMLNMKARRRVVMMIQFVVILGLFGFLNFESTIKIPIVNWIVPGGVLAAIGLILALYWGYTNSY